MKSLVILSLLIYLILACLTGCVAQPQENQASVAPPLATESPKPSPLPPTSTVPPTKTIAPSPTPFSPTTTPKPTSAPEEAVTMMEDVLGTWRFSLEGEKYLIQFQEDGFYNLGWEGNLTAVERGKYALEGNLLTFLSSPRECPDVGISIYEVYVIKIDEKPEKLHFILVGDDDCADRKKVLNDKTLPIFDP
jgi:hypothetical protein